MRLEALDTLPAKLFSSSSNEGKVKCDSSGVGYEDRAGLYRGGGGVS